MQSKDTSAVTIESVGMKQLESFLIFMTAVGLQTHQQTPEARFLQSGVCINTSSNGTSRGFG